MPDLDRHAPVHNTHVLAVELSATAGTPRFATSLLAAFAALAVGLATVGLYGALSYWVVHRRRELGVRAALGASRSRLIGLVLTEGMGVTVVGLLVGLLVAAGSARLIRTLVFGVDTPDPISFVLGTAILAVVALLACVIPAWRASTLDPAIVLRSE